MLNMDFDIDDADDSKKDLQTMLPRLARRITQKQRLGDYSNESSPSSLNHDGRKIISVLNPAQRTSSGSSIDVGASTVFDNVHNAGSLPPSARRRHTRKSVTGSICYAAQDLPPAIKSLREQDIYNEPDSAADRAIHAVSQMMFQQADGSNATNTYTDSESFGNNANVDTSQTPQQQQLQRVEGRIVQQDHAQYALTYGMMLGIRVTTGRRDQPGTQRTSSMSMPARDSSFSTYNGSSRNSPSPGLMVEEERELMPEDFSQTTKLLFLPEGNVSGPFPTPPHRLPFAFGFKDYMPNVFRALRALSNVDEADYMTSLAGDFNYIEFLANSKSGQFFFYSHDGRFMIKTQTREEAKLLREMLPSYVKHLVDHPDSLLARFYGLHRVEMPTLKRRTFFVVMQSVFYCDKEPPLTLHVKYDLKGSTVGRRTDDADCEDGAVQKDINFAEQNRKICLGKDRILLFAETLRADTSYLRELRIMDYSLLIGVYDPIEEAHLSSKQQKQMRRRSSGGVILAKRRDDEHTVVDEAYAGIGAWQPPSLFNSYYGGIRSAGNGGGTPGTQEVYFMGIIDILQVYNTNKRLENFFKGFSYDRKQLSAVDPALYAERMVNFLLSHSDYHDAIAASKHSAKNQIQGRHSAPSISPNGNIVHKPHSNYVESNNTVAAAGRQRAASTSAAATPLNPAPHSNLPSHHSASNFSKPSTAASPPPPPPPPAVLSPTALPHDRQLHHNQPGSKGNISRSGGSSITASNASDFSMAARPVNNPTRSNNSSFRNQSSGRNDASDYKLL